MIIDPTHSWICFGDGFTVQINQIIDNFMDDTIFVSLDTYINPEDIEKFRSVFPVAVDLLYQLSSHCDGARFVGFNLRRKYLHLLNENPNAPMLFYELTIMDKRTQFTFDILRDQLRKKLQKLSEDSVRLTAAYEVQVGNYAIAQKEEYLEKERDMKIIKEHQIFIPEPGMEVSEGQLPADISERGDDE